jgi:predicted DNA-binding ribbon-helix-helix protein
MDESTFQKRSLTLKGHKTSVALEKAFWTVLEEVAKSRSVSLPQLVNEIDEKRKGSLASSLRLCAMAYALKLK